MKSNSDTLAMFTDPSPQLHADLLPYLSYDDDEIPMLQHPLLVQGFAYPSMYNLLNQMYLQQRKQAADALASRNWFAYVWSHSRPYRLEALRRCVRAGLNGADYWRLVALVWMDCENVHQQIPLWRETWTRNTPFRNQVMDKKEQKAYAAMADETVIWRGTAHRGSVEGLSWTTNKKKAIWFAQRAHHYSGRETSPLLVSARVQRADVLATLLGRKENEIVCQEVTVTSVVGVKAA